MTQIEHGQANPSLVTVTRIARQLGTEFTALLEPALTESAIETHLGHEHMLVWTSDAGSSAHLLKPPRPGRQTYGCGACCQGTPIAVFLIRSSPKNCSTWSRGL